jgi:isopenicillin N synthase-like dioxygenase
MCEYCWGNVPGSPEFTGGEDMEEALQEQWSIKNDIDAEWALVQITEEKAEAQRLINVCETRILEYQEKVRQYQEQLDRNTAYLKGQLQAYFAQVPHKKTKTQETYKLPSGTLKLKYPTLEFIRDEKVLGEFLKTNNYT